MALAPIKSIMKLRLSSHATPKKYLSYVCFLVDQKLIIWRMVHHNGELEKA